MSESSSITWTESTWQPMTGCSKFSEGCRNCYAGLMAKRLQRMGQDRYRDGFDVTLHADQLNVPMTWRNPRRVFVASMGDLFHKDVPDSFLVRVFVAMQEAGWHTFQTLTKRAERLEQLTGKLTWPSNVWQGVSVENQAAVRRIDHLRRCGAAVKWVSFEPLLGPIGDLDLHGIDWVVVGGESGAGARQCDVQWIRSIKESAEQAGCAVFVKQLGKRPTQGGVQFLVKHPKGGDMEEWPVDLRVRNYPTEAIVQWRGL